MPIYVEISPLHRLVTIIARGTVSGDEVRGTAQKLAEARVRRFAKIVEVAGGTFDFKPQDVLELAQVLRGDTDGRGPIAFVVRSMDQPFPRMFADRTASERPVDLFKSIHEARAWIAKAQSAGQNVGQSTAQSAGQAVVRPAANAVQGQTDAWADPDRQGTVIRGSRAREFTTRELVH
jgi:hypothetical protein